MSTIKHEYTTDTLREILKVFVQMDNQYHEELTMTPANTVLFFLDEVDRQRTIIDKEDNKPLIQRFIDLFKRRNAIKYVQIFDQKKPFIAAIKTHNPKCEVCPVKQKAQKNRGFIKHSK